MHNIKDIRNNLIDFENLIKTRNVNLDVKHLADLDVKNRKLIQEKELLEKEKKDISKSRDKSLFSKSKEISNKLNKIINDQQVIKIKLQDILSSLPNLPLKDVPVGIL